MGRLLVFLAALSAVHAATQEELDAVGMRCYKNGTYIERNVSRALELLPWIDPSLDTHIYVHGWTENPDTIASQSVIQAYIKRGDINICALNYSDIAVLDYTIASSSAPAIGSILAQFLNTWTAAKQSYDPSRLTLVGFSLGALVCGHGARNTAVRVPRMNALDPAVPASNDNSTVLKASDVDFLCCIHTDIGFLGTDHSYGCDFYPNNGTQFQPGCPKLVMPSTGWNLCSHYRSTSYYSRSLLDEKAFVASECPDRAAFNSGSCNNNAKSIMGFATPVGTKGTYYLSTDPKYPYGRNDAGAQAPPYI